MESNIAKELGCEFNPIVLIKSDKIDENAFGPKSNMGPYHLPLGFACSGFSCEPRTVRKSRGL